MYYHFRDIKQQVNILDVARHYGVKVNSRGLGLCPFHREKSPSFSISESKQIFKCFSCDISGDVFTLVSKLLNVTPIEAMKVINNNFGCGLDLDKSNYTNNFEKKKQLEEQFKRWYTSTYNELCDYYKLLKMWKSKCNLEDKQYIEALQNIDKIEYYIDFLTNATDEEKIIFWKQKVVNKVVKSSGSTD